MHVQYPWLKVGKGILLTAMLVLLTGCSFSSSLSDDIGEPAPVPFYTEEPQARANTLASSLTPPLAQGLTSWTELAPVIQTSLKYARTHEPEQVAVAHGDLAVTWGDVVTALVRL